MSTKPKSRHAYQAPKHVRENRGSARERGYTREWEKARLRFLMDHPLCRHCEAQGIVQAAEEVDHIVPHRGDMELFWAMANLQALCKRCHSQKTRRGE
jgi:5-methylcytosine-specific restriction protein A